MPLDPGRDVDAVAKDILAVDDNVADIDPDPEPDRIDFGAAEIVLPNLSLDFDCATDGVNCAREFYQRAIAHELDNAARMGGDRRIDQLAPKGIQRASVPASSIPIRREYPPRRPTGSLRASFDDAPPPCRTLPPETIAGVYGPLGRVSIEAPMSCRRRSCGSAGRVGQVLQRSPGHWIGGTRLAFCEL